MCASKFGISETEAIAIDQEFSERPFGSSSSGIARQRAFEGGLSQGSAPSDAIPNATDPIPVSCADIPRNPPENFRIGQHFTVATLSSRASLPHRVPAVNARGESRHTVVCNMRYLVENVLDPLFTHYQNEGFRIEVSSGFRNQRGVSNHNFGAAADLKFFNSSGVRITGRALSVITKTINEELKLPFTQMIHEADRLLHLACKRSGNSNPRIYWSTGYGTPTSGINEYRHNV